jgi:hypothetical protein
MENRPDVAFTYGRDIRTNEPRFESAPLVHDYQSRVITGCDFWQMSGQAGRNLVPTPTAVVRTSAQKRVGGYRKHLPHSGDLEMWLRLAAVGSVGIIDAAQAFYRTHGDQMSTGFRDLRDLRQRKQAFSAAAAEWGDQVPDGRNALAAADSRVAEVAFWAGSRAFDAGAVGFCDEALAFALSLDPALKQSKSWRRLALKRVVGHGLWSALRPALNWARSRRTVTDALAGPEGVAKS